MFKNKKGIKIASLSIVGLLLASFILFAPLHTALVFYNKNTNDIQAFLPIQAGDTFQIIFTHSIHLTDVVEKYVIEDDFSIKQYEIVYEEFGIGMPSHAEEGETFVYENGKYHIKDLDNIFPSMKIRNGKTVSKHRLIWKKQSEGKEHKVSFNDYFVPGDWYTVKVTRLALWDYWKEVRIHESFTR